MTETKIKGVLKTWKADRGFGFIKPDNGEKDIFIHISSLKKIDRRPARGDVIYYQIEKDDQGKDKAVNAFIEGTEEFNKKTGSSFKVNKWLMVTMMGILILVLAGIFFYLYK